ncbi:MAG: hypothetical protein WHS65_10510 [Melioribacteraceae bacterium]
MKIAKMMTTIIKKSFLLVLVLSLSSYSQEKIILNTSKNFFHYGETEFNLNDVFLFQRIDRIKSNEFFFDSSTVWLQTKYLIDNFNEGRTNFENYSEMMTSPLLAKYYESQNYAPLKTILQSVQIGAIGYLAYLHLKKYGFLKKK